MKKKLFSPALFALFLLASCGNGGGESTPVVRPSGSTNSSAPTSSAPAGDSSEPVGESSQPVQESSQPAGDSSQPVGESSQPVQESSQPVQESSEPAGESSQPIQESSQPAGDSSQPSGVKTEYVFEAEYCPCIEDMDGATYSGGTSSYGLIGKDRDHDMNASNGWYVHFMYVEGSVLEFNIVSDRDIEDVKFVARFSAEYRDITFDDIMFPIKVNGSDLEYGEISITGVPNQGGGNKAFADFVIGENLSFKKGTNKIELVVDNNILMYGTALSTAPMTDCIKLTTEAVLTWPEESPENLDQF